MFMYSCSYLHEQTNPTLKATAQDKNKFFHMGRKKCASMELHMFIFSFCFQDDSICGSG